MHNLEPARPVGLADDDLGDIARGTDAQHLVDNFVAGNRDRLAAELLGKAQAFGDPVPLGFRQRLAAPRFDIECDPGRVKLIGDALCVADKARTARVFADADEDAFTRGPGARDRMRLHVAEKLLVHTLRGAAQRQFAERRQIAWRKIMIQRPLGLGRYIYLPFLQALDQIGRGNIDDLDIVGAVQDGVRHRLPYPHAGDARDDIVQALHVLDVQRRKDVDPGLEQFLDIDPALGMAAAGGVGMGQFVDEHEIGPAGEDGVEVHLVEHMARMLDPAPRNDLETLDQSLRFRPAMRLDNPDDDIRAVLPALPGIEQHFIGLADARRGPKKHFKPASVIRGRP